MSDMSLDAIGRDHLLPARVSDYLALLKPKVMTLVVFSGFVGAYLAPGFRDMHPAILFTAMLCLALGAGAAGAINMWYDRDIDTLMTRTRLRPIPAGRIEPGSALAFAMVVALFAVAMMGLAVNYLAAGVLLFSIFFYAVVYTMGLKRRTPQNIVIGGAAGAFPPIIGWAAANGDITLLPICLFLLIFFWTPPHFWALALFIKDEYAAAKVPMLPVVAGVRATKVQMLVYTLILFPLSLAPFALGACGWIYAAGASVMSVLFIISAIKVLRSEEMKPARAMFGFSILYLFALLTLMIIDKV